jgi:hypothetical protein
MKGEVKVPCGIRNLIKNSAEKCVKQNVSLPKNFCKQAEIYRKAQTAKYEDKCGKVGGKSRRSTRKNRTFKKRK